jgi:hypothetical protein
MQSCHDCSQATKYCPHCFPIASPSHRDGPANFISESDIKQVKLGGGWTQRKNSEGRIWYQQSKTNQATFTLPTAINSISEDNPQSLRRATIGGLPSEEETPSLPPRPSHPPRATTAPLPPGWEARKTMEGRRYYVCHETKKASWERPTVLDSTNTTKVNGNQKRRVSMNPSVPNSQQTKGTARAQNLPTTTSQTPAPAVIQTAIPATAQAPAPASSTALTAADRAAALKKKKRNDLMMVVGKSVLKGVVTGAIEGEMKNLMSS